MHGEVGYRYIAIFSDFRTLNLTSRDATYVSSIYGALGVRF